MKRIALTVLLLLAALAPAPARAQVDGAADQAAARAVVTRLFDAMAAGDGSRLGQLFTADARLQTAAVCRDGTVMMQTTSVDTFAAFVSQPHDFEEYERLDAWHVRIDGPLAVVTVDYSFFTDYRLSHYGIEAFQLFKSAEGWKIFQLTDTRRRTGCPGQPAGGS